MLSAHEPLSMCSILPPEYMQYGCVGTPVPSIEIKFLDAPEAGYITSEEPQRGEILIRGPSVTKGYFKRDDLNNDEEIFTKDGWLRTGDIGVWNKDGTLSIVDRIKNLVKLSGGEVMSSGLQLSSSCTNGRFPPSTSLLNASSPPTNPSMS